MSLAGVVVASLVASLAAASADASPRSGGIRWHNLSVSVDGKRGSGDFSDCGDPATPQRGRLCLLKRSSFYVPNGHVCGILGPSGSGKSTLLAALGGTTPRGAGMEITGSVWIEGEERGDGATAPGRVERSYLSAAAGEVAMLHQQDSFFSMMTPRETLDLAAYLQLDGDGVRSIKNRGDVVNRTLDSLGLAHVSDRPVGDRSLGVAHGQGTSGGLSGGERRRLSLAVELITFPRLFLGDEPTTGLDSTQAEKVVGLIVKMGKQRHIPAVLSLHQPRASIWKKLDSFILLAPGGKVIYMGPRRLAGAYFASHFGYKIPAETNPAEFFIDLVSIDTEDPDQAALDLQRINMMASIFGAENHARGTVGFGNTPPPPGTSRKRRSLATSNFNPLRGIKNSFGRFGALFIRAWRQNIRNHRVNLLRLCTSVGQALLFSELFASVKSVETGRSVADRTALLSFGVINMVMMGIMKTLHLFGNEKIVVTRERMRCEYTGLEYLMSKALAEIPLDAAFAAAFAAVLKSRTSLRTPLSVLSGTFSLLAAAGASLGFAVGSFAPGVESAMAIGTPLTIVLMAVGIINPSGVVVREGGTPWIVQWLKNISPIRWAIEATCVAEFRGMEFGETSKGSSDKRGGRRGMWGSRVRWSDLPRMGGLALVQSGDQVLDALGLGKATYSNLMRSLLTLSGINLFVSWIGLTFCRPNFLEVKDGFLSDGEGGATRVPSGGEIISQLE